MVKRPTRHGCRVIRVIRVLYRVNRVKKHIWSIWVARVIGATRVIRDIKVFRGSIN